MLELNNETLDSMKTKKGGYTYETLALLGVYAVDGKLPPWRHRIVGTVVSGWREQRIRRLISEVSRQRNLFPEPKPLPAQKSVRKPDPSPANFARGATGVYYCTNCRSFGASYGFSCCEHCGRSPDNERMESEFRAICG